MSGGKVDVKKVMNNLKGKVDAVAFIDTDEPDVVKAYVRVRADLVPLIDVLSNEIINKKEYFWIGAWIHYISMELYGCSNLDKRRCLQPFLSVAYSPLMLKVSGNFIKTDKIFVPDITLLYWNKKKAVYSRKYGEVDYILYEVDIPLRAIFEYRSKVKELVLKHLKVLIEQALKDGRKSTATIYKKMCDVIKNYDFSKVFSQSAVLNFERVEIVNTVVCFDKSVLRGTWASDMYDEICSINSIDCFCLIQPGLDYTVAKLNIQDFIEDALKDGSSGRAYLFDTLADAVFLYNVLRTYFEKHSELSEIQFCRDYQNAEFTGDGWSSMSTENWFDDCNEVINRKEFLNNPVQVIVKLIQNNYIEVDYDFDHRFGEGKNIYIYSIAPALRIVTE